MIGAILFIFGLAVGSFLNVVSLRYDPDSEKSIFSMKPIGGRSHCPHCRHILAWYDLVPIISFLFLFGKCGYCHHKISWQYPIVELISGGIALLPLYFYKIYNLSALSAVGEPMTLYWGLIAIWISAFFIFLLISIIDFRWTIIPDELNIALGGLGLARIALLYYFDKFDAVMGTFLGGYAQIFGLREGVLLNHLIAVMFGILFFGTIIYITRGRGMGMGDLKLSAALGLLLGWPDILITILLSFILGSIYSIFKIVFGHLHLKDAVPFGPFIVLAAAVVLFFGEELLRVYFTVFIP